MKAQSLRAKVQLETLAGYRDPNVLLEHAMAVMTRLAKSGEGETAREAAQLLAECRERLRRREHAGLERSGE